MKRMLILVVIAMLSGPLFADEATIVDFSVLAADIRVKASEDDESDKPNQNRQTLMDFSHVAGGSFTKEQKNTMKTSLAIDNWEITLASSARTVGNVGRSYTREATSKERWGENVKVMGVRIHFPVEPHHSWAIVRPPFDIPAFEPPAEISDDGEITPAEDQDGITSPSRFESQGTDDDDKPTPAYGVVKNVGIIKEVAVNVYGLNFPHSLSVILIDSEGKSRNIFIDYLKFDGWRERKWVNPAYMEEVRNREIRLYPLYPTSTPFVKFGGFLIQRDASQPGGDFIAYFKDVKIIYDRAVLNTDRDIDDEGLWNIIYQRESARKVWEMERFGQNQVLRYLEQQKKATELPFGHPGRNENNDQ
ncbi:MAG: flagellar filament outer layer protein FlaA [Treponema sp.]|nr:flagellar filament outer layer protein FlaA [Treponema sp.]